MPRRYELKKRAERMAETRQRIVDAAVALHTTLGPAATTVSAIAEEAGVQRHTFYSHFPAMKDLFRACSSHWLELHPQPDLGLALGAESPAERLRGALTALYAWYEEVEEHLLLFERDAHVFPEWNDEAEADRTRLRDALTDGEGPRTRAAVGHALDFHTWRSLARREGLARDEAADLMVALAFG
jgi:AcrR family transcriptional regulator